MKKDEYRLQARDTSNRTVQRSISAPSMIAARKKAKEMTKAQNWTLLSVQKKKVYEYVVRRGANTVRGYQNAYSREEVIAALRQLKFEVKSVRRHIEFQMQAPSGELVGFIGASARLLEQQLPFNDILQIMSTNVKNKHLRNAIRGIIKDLKEGADSREAFLRQAKVFGKDTALMLGIASKSGDMTAIFKSVAYFVERQADFKKGLSSSLILPAVTSVALIGAIAYYVIYLLPQMVKLLGPLGAALPPMTAATMHFSEVLQSNMLLIVTTITALTVGFYSYIKTPGGQYLMDRYIIKIPYVGKILRNMSVELFCRVLGILYTSGENIDAIQQAAEASRNRYLERQIKTVAIPAMLKYGTELAKALEFTTFFPEIVISRFRTAGETGDVKATAVQVADYFEMENKYAMKNLISFIEVSISVMIMGAMIFLTYLSSETASIKVTGQ